MSAYILTQQAERDLNEIWEHIAGQSIDSADAVLDEIRQALISSLLLRGLGTAARMCAIQPTASGARTTSSSHIYVTLSRFRSFV
jgi:plasmid stabilization system protein ParE